PFKEEILEICSRENLIYNLRNKRGVIGEFFYGLFNPNKITDEEKVQMNFLRGELMLDYWNRFVVPDLKKWDLNPMMYKKEEENLVEDDLLLNLVFSEKPYDLFGKELSEQVDLNSLEGKMFIADKIMRAFRSSRYNLWLEEVSKNNASSKVINLIDSDDFESLSDIELYFFYTCNFYDKYNQRSAILTRKGEWLGQEPLFVNALFSYYQFVRPIARVAKIFSENELDVIFENTYKKTILPEGLREAKNAAFRNYVTVKENADNYVFDLENNCIVFDNSLVEKYFNAVYKLGRATKDYSNIKMGCPALRLKSDLFEKSLFHDVFKFQTEVFKNVYLRYYGIL
ncbi:MAG: hypothetical protein KC589_02095, partial [Nanoarchaeota archaeon]|nr:hypothetical protein [Nanoarchaeota archaeon]